MGFGGGSAPTPPPAQPVTPVPQEDDPKNLETQRKTAIAAKGREGYSAHLLSKGSKDEGPSGPSSPGSGKSQMLG
jgi:hypothetical protein